MSIVAGWRKVDEFHDKIDSWTTFFNNRMTKKVEVFRQGKNSWSASVNGNWLIQDVSKGVAMQAAVAYMKRVKV